MALLIIIIFSFSNRDLDSVLSKKDIEFSKTSFSSKFEICFESFTIRFKDSFLSPSFLPYISIILFFFKLIFLIQKILRSLHS